MLFRTAVIATLAATAAALYSSNSKVIQLTDKDFKQVLKGDELWIVEFYAPYVPCQGAERRTRHPSQHLPIISPTSPATVLDAGGVATARTLRPSTRKLQAC